MMQRAYCTIDRSIGARGTRAAPVPGMARGSGVDSARGSGEQVAGAVKRKAPAIREVRRVTPLHELQPRLLVEWKYILD